MNRMSVAIPAGLIAGAFVGLMIGASGCNGSSGPT